MIAWMFLFAAAQGLTEKQISTPKVCAGVTPPRELFRYGGVNRKPWPKSIELTSKPARVEDFFGQGTREIQVDWCREDLSPRRVRRLVLDVWRGIFRFAEPQPVWIEATFVAFSATLVDSDRTRRRFQSNGREAAIEDRQGVVWYFRLRDAVR